MSKNNTVQLYFTLGGVELSLNLFSLPRDVPDPLPVPVPVAHISNCKCRQDLTKLSSLRYTRQMSQDTKVNADFHLNLISLNTCKRFCNYFSKQVLIMTFLPPANEVWGKVIFSAACVKNSVHGGGGGIPACIAGGIPACLAAVGWYPSIPCRFPGPHPGGKLGVWPGGSPGPYPRGKLRGLAGGSPGPHWGEGVLQAHTGGGVLQAHTRGGLQAHTQGKCIPACTEADPPRLLLWAVRILLECILVLI